ncbi:MAG TPA: hypothetical protein VFP46_01420 [Candidatus Paceibacterota bacterium]|nr:hypothetical protein [Candidatus Paceibacterota bacterium]
MKSKKAIDRSLCWLVILVVAVIIIGFAYTKPTFARDIQSVPIPSTGEKSLATCMGTPVSDFFDQDTGERQLVFLVFEDCGGSMSSYTPVTQLRRVVSAPSAGVQFMLFAPANPQFQLAGLWPVQAGDAVWIPDFVAFSTRLGSAIFNAMPDIGNSRVDALIIGDVGVARRKCGIGGCESTALGMGYFSIDHATAAWPGTEVRDSSGNLAGVLVGSDPASGRSLVMGAGAIIAALNEANLSQKGSRPPRPEQQ